MTHIANTLVNERQWTSINIIVECFQEEEEVNVDQLRGHLAADDEH